MKAENKKLSKFIYRTTFFVFISFLTMATVLPMAHLQASFWSECTALLTRAQTPNPTDSDLKKFDEQLWNQILEPVKTELTAFRNLPDEAKTDYLKKVAAEVKSKMISQSGANKIGAHYNLHGGRRRDYLDKDGIRLTMGDSGVDLGFSRDYRRKVYFFHLDHFDLYQVLNERNPNHIFIKKRMGDTLILFDVERAEKHIQNLSKSHPIESTEIFIAASTDAIASDGHIGVPKSAFLSPPLSVFKDYRQRLGTGRLSWDEETLVTLRLIEASVQK